MIPLNAFLTGLHGISNFLNSRKLTLALAACILILLGCGDKSTSNKTPNSPSNLAGHPLSPSSLFLFWIDNSDNETSFLVYRKSDGDWANVAVTPSNQISFTDTSLQDSTTYIYRVSAKSDAGESAPSESLILSTFSLGLPPPAPSNPSPADDSAGVPAHVTLAWACTDPDGDSLRFDIYFGSGSYLDLIDSNLVESSLVLNPLGYNTEYVWRVIARDNFHHTTTGPVWHFRTRPNSRPGTPSDPFPSDDSVNVAVNLLLGWQCSDPDSDALSYDIYLGPESNETLVGQNIPQNEFNPGPLLYSTRYSWSIVARDTFGNETHGLHWIFTTVDSAYALTVLLRGMGQVTFSPDRPSFAYGDSVILTAIPDPAWSFSGWSGDIVSHDNPLALVINRDLSLVANFIEGNPTTATIAGAVTWPGHALSDHTYFFADSLSSGNLYLVGQSTVDPVTGNFTLTISNMPGPLPLLFEAHDDVNDNGAWDPLDAGDGWGYYDHNGNGQWGLSDTMYVAPGDYLTNINIELHPITSSKMPGKSVSK